MTCRETKCELGMRVCTVQCSLCILQPCKGLRLRLIRVSKLQGQGKAKAKAKARKGKLQGQDKGLRLSWLVTLD